MAATPPTAEYLNRSSIMLRGWSTTMIREQLGAPDIWTANPHNPTWAPMALWSTARVLAAEASPAFAPRPRRGLKR